VLISALSKQAVRRRADFTTRKQPCYWASLFTAANATEQDRYLVAPACAGCICPHF
jgi:hypothetical protein